MFDSSNLAAAPSPYGIAKSVEMVERLSREVDNKGHQILLRNVNS
jgi:hypothetical protein